MPISTLTTNYGNRTKDIHIFQGVDPTKGTSIVTPSFGKISQFCTGIQKLIQRYTICLLTNIGSQVNYPTFGTDLLQRLRTSNHVSKLDFVGIFNFANMDVIEQFREYQRAQTGIPEDEQLDTAILENISVTAGAVSLRIKLYPVQREPVEFVIPLPDYE